MKCNNDVFKGGAHMTPSGEAKEQVPFKKKYKSTVLPWTALLYALAFIPTYIGVLNHNNGLVNFGLAVIAILTAIVVYFG